MVAEDPSLGYIALTGASLGVVHVLTGPDHISALASLSANGSYRAFRLGVNWGLGHSTGLIFAYLVFALGNGGKELNFSPDVGRFLDASVGIFMLGLGGYSGVKALLEYRASSPAGGGSVVYRYQTVSSDAFDNDPDIEMRTFNGDFDGGEDDSGDDASGREQLRTGEPSEDSRKPQAPCEEVCGTHHHHPSTSSFLALFCQRDRRPTPLPPSPPHSNLSASSASSSSTSRRSQLLSFAVGILHGFAGPGGILGVVPALRMRVSGAVLYLFAFCVSSIIVMGTFAACYGEASARMGSTRKLKMGVACVSAGASLVVGIVWLILTFEGKLDEVFG